MKETKEKFKQFVIEQLKDYDKWREASPDGYAEIITDEAVKLFCQPDDIKSLPDSDEIRMKARELDEKDFAQWMWEIEKGNVL